MDNYLALIRRADFVDLFKYGSLHVNKDLTRLFTCPVESLSEKETIFRDLTAFANAFESSFSYLFIHYTKSAGRSNDIHISDVKHIYPLDYEAKRELSLAFDPRIRIEEPLWPDAVREFQKKNTIEGCMNGVLNLWKIYGIEMSMEEIGNSYVTPSILREVVDELYANEHPEGDLPIWVYAMRYERHGFYPPNTIGCFMDAVHVIFNYMKKQELDSEAIESTNIIQFLRRLDSSLEKKQFNLILKELSKEESATPILEKAKEIEPSVDLIKCLALFYIYRNRYIEEFRYEEDWAKTGKKNGKEFYVAAYMLGCILQHDHTYDCLYEHLPLDIFKKREVLPNEKMTEQVGVIIESKINKKEAEGMEETPIVPTNGQEPPEDTKHFSDTLYGYVGKPLPKPILLKKSPKARKTVIAYTEEEYINYLNLGYRDYSENTSKPTRKNNKK